MRFFTIEPPSSPSTHNAATADASTQLSIPEFLQLCFTKHPFRRTVPLQLHEDLSDAQCPSDSGNPREVTFADAATQLSFAEFFERCILSDAYRRAISHFPNRSTLVLATVSATPAAVVALCLPLARSLTAHHLRHQDSRIKHAWVLPTTSLLKLRPCVTIRIMALL